MQLKRYTTQELQELIPNIFFKYMLDSGVEEVKKSYEENKEEYKRARELYKEAFMKGNLEESTVPSVEEQLRYLEKGLQYLEYSNLKNQKEIMFKQASLVKVKDLFQSIDSISTLSLTWLTSV